MTKGQGIYVDR